MRRLNKIQPDPDPEGVLDELLGRSEMASKLEARGSNQRTERIDDMESAMTGVSEEVVGRESREVKRTEDGDEVFVWRSNNGDGPSSNIGQRRSMSTVARSWSTCNGRFRGIFENSLERSQSQLSVYTDDV